MGVAVLIHPNSAAKLVDSKTDLAGREVTAVIDFHGQCFQIINVYGPNNHREQEIFFDNLWHFKYSNLEAIVVGGPLVIQLKYCLVLPLLNKVDYYYYYIISLSISAEAMTVLETGLSRSSTLSWSHSL